ncbi:MAG: hypothetical protein ACREU6_09245, partial [Steroidobacteraceae bacterium]
MKIVRHIAPDMRQALRSIREQLGEDAVILSSRRIPEGVEVTAAVDFDATSLQRAMATPVESLADSPLLAQRAPAAADSRPPSARAPKADAPSHQGVASERAAGSHQAAASHSHAAASHYFPAPAAADVLPFAHMLAPEAVPAFAPTSPAALAAPPANSLAPLAATRFAPPPAPVASAPHSGSAPAASFSAPAAPAAESSPARREPTFSL